MKIKKKKYIIVGDNNFWYVTTNEITEAELQDELEEAKTAISNGDYSDSEFNKPSKLLVYEANELMRMDLDR